MGFVCFKPKHCPLVGSLGTPSGQLFLEGLSQSCTKRVRSRAFWRDMGLASMTINALCGGAPPPANTRCSRTRSCVPWWPESDMSAPGCPPGPQCRLGQSPWTADPPDSFGILLIVLTGPRHDHLQSSGLRGLLPGRRGGPGRAMLSGSRWPGAPTPARPQGMCVRVCESVRISL